MGGVAREVKPAILSKGVKSYLIGRDAIGAWVNADNPVDSLSMTQLKGIFTGPITNWSEVGGRDAEISVYIVNPQSATRKVFAKVVLEGAQYEGKINTVKPDVAILDKVASDVNAIGQLSFAFGAGHPKASDVKKVAVEGQAATVDNPNYPITRPLYLITKSEPTGATKAFIEWSLSAEGQAVVKKYFVGR